MDSVLNQDLMNTGMEAIQKISFKLICRLAIDLVAIFILIRGVYYRYYHRSELFFTFFIFNLVIFLICFLLNKVDLSMGAAFGLFAVFSMLRYRTEDISIKDMSYLFLVIALGLVNAVTKIKDASDGYEYIFLSLINGLVILLAFLLESQVLFRKESVQIITYDNIDLIKAGHTDALIKDISERTGLKVNRVSISRIDFLRDSALIKVFYYED